MIDPEEAVGLDWDAIEAALAALRKIPGVYAVNFFTPADVVTIDDDGYPAALPREEGDEILAELQGRLMQHTTQVGRDIIDEVVHERLYKGKG